MINKVVLIINEPDSCYDCPIRNYTKCGMTGKLIEFEKIPNYCPLLKLPEKDNGVYYPDEYKDGFKDGWNACIDKISNVKNNEMVD